MFATAADVPPELFERILDFAVGDVGMSKRELGMCALTCTYWAEKVQPRIFDHIMLRSAEDVRTLSSFFESEHSAVVEHLDFIVLEQHGPGKPWFHLAAIVLMPQLLGLTITVSIVDFHPQKATWPVRSIHGVLPRVTPAFSYNIRELTLADVRFRQFTDLIGLVAEIPALGTLTCCNITWPDLVLDAQIEAGVGRLPPLRRLPRGLRTVTLDRCPDVWSPIWFFVGRSRLVPHATDPIAEINMNIPDALAIYDTTRLFLNTLDPASFAESEYRVFFHSSGDLYYLEFTEMTDEDEDAGVPDSRRLPDITFTLGRPTRDPRLPFATPLPPAMENIYFVDAIELDLHEYPLDCYKLPLYDWGAFDATSASFSRLGRVTFGFREKAGAQRFLGLDTDAAAAATNSETAPEPDEDDEVHGLSARMNQLGQANKIRCAYWDAQLDGYVRVPGEDTAQGTAKNTPHIPHLDSV